MESLLKQKRILRALIILNVAATATPKELVTCPRPVLCPCGDTGTSVKFCVGVERPDDVCSRWSECRSCRDGLGVCLECLEGSGGAHCSKGKKLVRRKRRPTSRPNVFGPPERAEIPKIRIGGKCRDPGYDPTSVRNPQVVAAGGHRHGTRLEYACIEGYRLVGKGNITCRVTGKWSSERPMCRIRPREPDLKPIYCQNPGPVSDGNITYYLPLGDENQSPPSSLDDPELPDGSRLEYSCRFGYSMQGQRVLDCQRIGGWSHDPPTCKRQLSWQPTTVLDRSKVFCSDPGTDPNGSRESRKPPDRRGFPLHTMLDYSCNPGYLIVGTSSLFCFSNDRWTSEAPRCEPENPEEKKTVTEQAQNPDGSEASCSDPGIDPNGRREPRLSPDGRGFPADTKLRYSCNRGFQITGTSSLTCIFGAWHPPKAPRCHPVSPNSDRLFCPNPGPLHNGQVVIVPALAGRISRLPIKNNEGEDLEHQRGTRLLYSCDYGFSLKGAEDITCEPTGNWSYPPPVCMTTVAEYRMSCFNPGKIIDGSVRPVFPDVGTVLSEGDPDYPEGTTLEYECNEGFEVEGDTVVTCLSIGIWTSRPPVCTPDCGRSMVTTDRKIVNGSRVEAGEWPWVVAIAVRRKGYSRVVCGGAVLSSRTVITAAHCLTRGGPNFTLYFGKRHRENDRDDGRVENRTSDEIIIHPDFSNVTMDSDIALITFEPKINFSPLVQPICLPTRQSTKKNIKTGSSGHVTGWGLNEKQAESQELMMAHLPIATESACLQSFRDHVRDFNQTLSRNMFCAGFPDARQATCRGDSGSPMVFFDPVSERFTLEGLVSFGVPAQCGLPGIYTVFTKVFKFLLWIDENTQ